MRSSILLMLSITLSIDAQVTGINTVVDLSHWNKNLNFVKIKEDGIEGIMHKATQGLKYIDPKFNQRKIDAVSQAIKWGGYHFADGTPGADQANHFLQVVGDDAATLLALDIEENPGGSTVNLTVAEDFVRTVYEKRGRYPLVYGSALLKEMVQGTKSVLLDCPLWIAQWGPKAIIPENTWANWTLWQYTDGSAGPQPHTVNGIGPCDRDTVNSALHLSIDDMWSTAGYTLE